MSETNSRCGILYFTVSSSPQWVSMLFAVANVSELIFKAGISSLSLILLNTSVGNVESASVAL